jgi:hypothetical protein
VLTVATGQGCPLVDGFTFTDGQTHSRTPQVKQDADLLPLDRDVPFSAQRLDDDQSRVLEHSKVTARGRPRMGEPPRQITHRHPTTPSVKHLQQVSAHGMIERAEARIDGIKVRQAL